METGPNNYSYPEHDSHATDSVADANPSPSVYLAGGFLEWSWNPLDILFRIFMLPVYGTTALVRRSLFELRIASLLLLLVFCFDWVAWFMVFNHLAHPNGLVLHGAGSWFALSAALMIAVAMVMLERSIMVSDTEDKTARSRFRKRAWARFGIIVLSAFITSQSVELIAFKGAIDARIFQEDIRRNMVEAADRYAERHHQDYERLSTANTDPNAKPDALASSAPAPLPASAEAPPAADSGSSGQPLPGSLPASTIRDQVVQFAIDEGVARNKKTEIDEQIKKKLRDQPALETQKTRAQTTLHDAQNTLRTMSERGLTPEQLQPYNESVQTAQRALGNVQGQIKALQHEIAALQAQSSQLGDKIVGTHVHSGILEEKAKTFEDFQKNYRAFMSELKKARKSEDIPAVGEFSFVQREYLDVEKLGIIFDLMTGHPPRWPEFAADSRILTNDVDIKGMKELEARNAAENGHLKWINWVKYLSFMLIALLIPGVALIYKTTATEDLVAYFSNGYQAARMHPEALEHEVTRETMDRKHRVMARPAYGAGDD
jgi:hypothetical protein